MISFALDEEQQLIQETVRRFAAESIRPRLREHERDGVPAELRAQFHALGLGLLDAPEAVGGQGARLVTAMLAHEELAYGDAGSAVALWAPHAAAQAILTLGDEAQVRRFLGRFAGAQGAGRLGAVAYGEKAAPLEGFATVARPRGDRWVLDGHKAWVVSGGAADLHVVFAQREGTSGWDGAAAFVVEAGTPGLAAGARHVTLGLNAVQASEVILTGCEVPDANRLLGGGDFVAATGRFLARLGLVNAARQVGLARAAYEYALEYTQARTAFGKPVAHFQAVSFTLAEMHMDVEATRWLVWKAAAELEQGKTVTALEAVAHANEAAWRVADHGVQLLGGAGYVRDHPVEKWLRDTKTLALFSPPSEHVAHGVASEALGHAVASVLPSSAIQPFFT